MNVKSLITLFAFAGLAASCSNSDFDDSGTRPTDGRAEIQIAFSGTGESQEYTRAIASESENKIDQLRIYLFAAANQTGPFYYLETWTEGTDYDPAAPAQTNFKIQDAGTSKKGILYPNELKGLPWIKLLCVANNGTAPKFYGETGTEILNPMTKVVTDAAGTVTTVGTTEAAFKAAFSDTDYYGYNDEGIVSSDILGDTHGGVFDPTQTDVNTVDGTTMARTVSFYDNEYGFTCNMIRTLLYFAEISE